MRYALLLAVPMVAVLFSNGCAAPQRAEVRKGSMSHPPLSEPVCTLSPSELREKRDALIPGLLKRADQVTDLENGCRMRFATRPRLLNELTRAVEQERTCCSFLRFQIIMEPNNGPVFFEVTGPPGTREMLRSL